MPSIRRSETYHSGVEPDLRGRSRSRFQPQVEIEELSEGETPMGKKEHRSSGGKHRSSRHKTRSPSTEYVRAIPLPQQHTRYAISHEGRTIPVGAFYRDDSPHHRKHSSSKQYYSSPKVSSHSSHAARVVEVRPPSSREASWAASPPGGSPSGGGYFPKFKTAKNYNEGDINYSPVPRSGYGRDEYVWA
jgi:hypothetical protein